MIAVPNGAASRLSPAVVTAGEALLSYGPPGVIDVAPARRRSRRKSPKHNMDDAEATMSTNHGPW